MTAEPTVSTRSPVDDVVGLPRVVGGVALGGAIHAGLVLGAWLAAMAPELQCPIDGCEPPNYFGQNVAYVMMLAPAYLIGCVAITGIAAGAFRRSASRWTVAHLAVPALGAASVGVLLLLWHLGRSAVWFWWHALLIGVPIAVVALATIAASLRERVVVWGGSR